MSTPTSENVVDRPPRGAHLWLVLAAGLFALPLVWMVLTSLKTPDQIKAEPYAWLPQPLAAGNYAESLSAMPLARYLGNTLLLCMGSVAGTLVSCTCAAYAFALLRWPGRDVWFGVLIATMLLPWQVTMAPRFEIIRAVGLYNTLGALIVPTLFGNAFYVFLLRQFFLTVPRETLDAARIDGCGEAAVLWRIVLPVARPALATVALLQFVAAWNDYGGPLLYLSDPRKFPLAYGLEQFVSAHSSETHLMLAAAVVFTLPILVLFFLTQRVFIRGIATTGLKG